MLKLENWYNELINETFNDSYIYESFVRKAFALKLIMFVIKYFINAQEKLFGPCIFALKRIKERPRKCSAACKAVFQLTVKLLT